jgi:hypothetical protein
MPRSRAALALLAAAIALSACSLFAADSATGDTPIDDTDPPVGGGAPDPVFVIAQGVADGPGISIDDAIGRGDATDVLVNGALFVDADGTVRLCSAIAESFPPQCGGSRLEVRGLDLAAVGALQQANGVRWADAVQLYGHVERP